MDLRKVKLFSGLGQDELETIAQVGRECVYPSRATVFVSGQEADGVYIILAGRVKVTMLNPDGREKTLAIMGEGETLGEVSLFGNPLRSAAVETLDRTTFMVISGADFIALLSVLPGLSVRIIELLSERLRRANKQIEDLSFHNARSRVICSLIYLAEEHGRRKGKEVVILFSLTHAELAKLAGVTRETATKVLNDLRDKELLNLPRGRIELLNLGGLQRQIL